MKNLKTILWGLLLICLGVILALNAFDVIDFNLFFKGWWTLFIIVPCLIDLISLDNVIGDLIGIALGVLLLLASRDILSFGVIWKLILPAVLVIIGLSLIFKNSINKAIHKEIKKHKKDDSKNYIAIFGEQKNNFANEEFKGANLTSIFGGLEIDLRDAIIKEDIVISVVSLFGGVDIFVPDNVKVEVSSVPIFGGVENKNRNKKKDGPIVYIDAVCIFGGIDIK